MNPSPRLPSDSSFALRGLALYGLFMGGAWAALRLTSGTRLGLLLGPVAAQAAMALVILAGSRNAPRWEPAAVQLPAARRLRLVPLALIALGGFLFQVALLAGTRGLTAASIPGITQRAEAPLVWAVVLLTSIVGAPLLEERFFRGMLQPLLGRRSLMLGLLGTAALFGIAHGFETPFRAVPTFLQGLALGGVTLLTGRLRGAVVIHALNNALVMTAALLLALLPRASAMGGVPTPGWSLALYALVGLTLVAVGLHGIARAPRFAATPDRLPPAR